MENAELTAPVLNAIFSMIHQMQIITTYKVVVQLSINDSKPFYTIVMQHYDNGETRIFPLELSAEDLATKNDIDLATQTFLDIFEMMEKPQELSKPKIHIVKG
jgi:hypothetical protein